MTLLRRSRVESSSLLSDFFLSHKFSISKGVQSLNHSQFNFRGIRGPAFVKGASQKKIGRRNNVKARDFFFSTRGGRPMATGHIEKTSFRRANSPTISFDCTNFDCRKSGNRISKEK